MSLQFHEVQGKLLPRDSIDITSWSRGLEIALTLSIELGDVTTAHAQLVGDTIQVVIEGFSPTTLDFREKHDQGYGLTLGPVGRGTYVLELVEGNHVIRQAGVVVK